MSAAELFADWKKEFGAFAGFTEAWQDPGALTLIAQGGEASLVFRHASETAQLGHIATSDPNAAQRLRELLSKAELGRQDAVLSLSSDDVLRPSVRLPHASYETLRRALGYEIERLSPISPDEVYFDFAVTGRDPASNTDDIELRIIRRDIVDSAVALCHAADLTVSAIRFEDDARLADWRAFPVDRAGLLRAEARRWGPALLLGAAVVLLLAILLALYLRGASVADDLTDRISAEGVRAAQVERLRHRIDRTVTQFAFLEKQRRAPSFVAVLNDVTRTLPDGTWITEFDLTGNHIRIDGYSHAASDLIAAFDRSGRFINAQFAAPVTQGTPGGVERFDLTFQLAGTAP